MRAKKFYLAEERSDEAQKIQIWLRVIKYFLSKCICNFISRVPTKGVFCRFGHLKIVFSAQNRFFSKNGPFLVILRPFWSFLVQKCFFLKIFFQKNDFLGVGDPSKSFFSSFFRFFLKNWHFLKKKIFGPKNFFCKKKSKKSPKSRKNAFFYHFM